MLLPISWQTRRWTRERGEKVKRKKEKHNTKGALARFCFIYFQDPFFQVKSESLALGRFSSAVF
jgi:hypothetical protein